MNGAIKIRPDLADISDAVRHLYVVARYFHENNVDAWSNLWHHGGRDSLGAAVHALEDQEFVLAVEEVYKRGRATAVSMSEELVAINDFTTCPKLKQYVERIRELRGSWEREDSPILTRCEEIITQRTNYPVDYWAIRKMIALHRDQLQRLIDLEPDLKRIEGSKRYAIENGTNKLIPATNGVPSDPARWSLSWWGIVCTIIAVPVTVVIALFQANSKPEDARSKQVTTGNGNTNISVGHLAVVSSSSLRPKQSEGRPVSPRVSISNSPGAITSINQQGGNFIVNQYAEEKVGEPKFMAVLVLKDEPEEGGFVSMYEGDFMADEEHFIICEVCDPNVRKISVFPAGGGFSSHGSPPQKPGCVIDALQTGTAKVRISVRTREKKEFPLPTCLIGNVEREFRKQGNLWQ